MRINFMLVVVCALLIFLGVGCASVVRSPDDTRFVPTVTSVTTVSPTSMIIMDATATATVTPTLAVSSTFTPTLAPLPGSLALLDSPPVIFFYNDGYLLRTDIEGSAVEQITSPLERISEEVWRMLADLPQVSPDGRWLIIYSSRGRWQLLDLYEGLVVDTGQGQPKLTPTWAPDSQRFAYLADDQLCIYELSDQTVSCSFTGEGLLGASWTPVGSHIAVAEVDFEAPCCTGRVWLVDPFTGEAKVVGAYDAPPEVTINEVFTWSASGSELMIKSTSENTPSVLFALGEQAATSFNKPVFAISPDGRYLLHHTGEVSQVDGSVLYSLPQDAGCEGRRLGIHNWAWSPDSDRLAYVVSCGTGEQMQQLSRVYMIDAYTGEVLWEQEMGIRLELVYWSPDGAYLLLDRLDEMYSSPELSPIWRLAADGTGTLETVVEKGFLLGVVPQWTQQNISG